MNKYPYFETHNHSHFSYLDGVSSPKDMAKKAKELGYPALALTDHGNIDGWYQFYKECKANDVIPILSCEFYVAYDKDDQEENPWKAGTFRTKRGHLIVHAKGNKGVAAIRELYNNSWVNFKEQGKKQIIFEKDLVKYAGKVCVQSACTGSYIDSEEKVIRFQKTFGSDFYLEIQPHKLDHTYDMDLKDFVPCEDIQVEHNKKIIAWARAHDVNLIITGDSHYPSQDDKLLQDILILNSFVGRKTGWCFYQDTNHMMDEEQWWTYYQLLGMEDVFNKQDLKKSLETLHTLIDKCKGVTLEKDPSLRKFEVETHPLYASGDSKEKLISKIIKDVGRYKKESVYTDRLKYELKVIRDKGFLDYFLIQEDIIRWNREKGYLVGPARGSAAGCLLAYYMDITKIDPIKYDLLFERFMDLSRDDYPDIDTDYEKQEETFQYIADKYGSEYVMRIGAYQTMKVKSAIKDAYRILYKERDYNYDLVNAVTHEIKDSNARGDGDQLEIFKDLIKASKVEFDEAKEKGVPWQRHNLFAFMMGKPDLVKAVGKLLGKVKNMRVHPCSMVILDEPVKDVLPVLTVKSGTSSEKWVTAFDGKGIEASGYLKFDILGLNTLNAISACLNEIKKYKKSTIEDEYNEHIIDITNNNGIWNLEPNDPKVLKMLSLGDNDNVFQFHQPLPRRLCQQVEVDTFNDSVAVVALVRPGPLKAGFPAIYAARKFGKIGLDEMYVEETLKGKKRDKIVKVKYNNSLMNEILKNTYNVITYQEQVQKLFIALGGFTPIESNKIRKAISKGERILIEESKPQFLKYATTKLDPVWTKKEVDAFYEDMIGFGSYCFNLSHSVSYAFIGYVCQFLKVYYPLEWWSGNLQHAGEKGSANILKTIQQKNYAPIKSVDINQSKGDFFFNGEAIVMPLRHIKGVGESGLNYIIEGQKEPYTSLKDFVERMPGRSVRKNSVLGLIVSGAFSEIEPDKTPQQLIEYYLKEIKKEKEISAEIQVIIDEEAAYERFHCEVDPFYQSNWVEKFAQFFDNRIIPINEIADYNDDTKVYIGGEITDLRYIKVKTGKSAGRKMAFITIQQLNDTVKVTLWPDQVTKIQSLLNGFKEKLAKSKTGGLVEVKGKVSRYRGEVGLQLIHIKEIRVG